jgi:hypothetical protein
LDQHVIPEWLLKAFSMEAPRGRVLATYNKASGEYGQAIPSKFMVEVDAHPTDVEIAFGKIESAAALASTRLVRRVEALPPGLYSVTDIRARASSASQPRSECIAVGSVCATARTPRL